MSAKGRILRLLSKLVLAEAELVSVRVLASNLWLLELQAASGSGGSWQPGDKLQVLLPDDEVRTFTPLSWGPDGASALLVYGHGDGPVSRWAPLLEAGQRLRFVGPQRSLVMPDGALTLFGDETSLAVAASYARARPGAVRAVFEVAAGLSLEGALAAIGLARAQVVYREPGAPRGLALERALETALGEVRGAVGITGGSELIQRVRARLRERGPLDIKTKTYWVPGRAGLD